jgi:non-canonical purine NTP pyrophosphatase (RdgB/HAM1 family)
MKKTLESLTFITGNKNKLKEVRAFLDFPLLHRGIELKEIQSLDLEEVVRFKAKEAYDYIGKPVLVEDTFLTIHALGRLPGPFIKWFWEEIGLDNLCRMIDIYSDRSATVSLAFGLFDGVRFEIFVGEMKGRISDFPRGSNGFGWNPIFIHEGFEKTWAELADKEKEPFSARRKAIKELEKYLEKTYQYSRKI